MKFLFSIWMWLIVPFVTLYSQCPVGDFILPPNACNEELLLIENLTGAAISQTWDFCSGDLSNSPQAQTSFTLSGVNGLPGVEFAKDGNIWFGFVTGTYTNTLYRLEFGNGTNSLPTFTENLGSLSGKLNSPGQVRIIRENGQWYGFVHNTTSGELLQLNFGNSLSNSFTVSIIFSGIGYSFSGFALGKDPVNGWICVLSTASNQVKIIRLGHTFATPTPSDILTSATVPNQNSLGDVDLINICGLWYGFADNFGNGNIYRFDFGSNLFSTPSITQIATITATNPGRLRIAKEGEDYFVFVIALDGTLTKLEFGVDIISSPNIVMEGSVGNVLQVNSYGLALAKENSEWTILALSQSNGQVYHINYPNICAATPSVSNEKNFQVKYTQAGVYQVSLESFYDSGTSTKTKTVTVSSNVAPDIDFNTANVCANSIVNFTSQNSSGNITSYSWSFGDASTSSQPNPSHIYTSAATYEVGLIVTASNGCTNTATPKDLVIYNQPVADFDLPSVSPICTNQEYTFINSSTFDPLSNPTWEWRLNGALVSNDQNLSQQFSSTIAQEIRLKALIPGCENEVIKNIASIQEGPQTDFTFSNSCQLAPVSFTNATSGSVTDFSWDFGDGNNSSQTNPTKTFQNSGTFHVTLHTTNAAGCQNSAEKPITIYSKPQTNFSIDLPPFSCAGSPSQFNDITPSLTDSNITTWLWGFGDIANGTSAQKNPTYTFSLSGDYQVSLTATTNFGCTASIQKRVTISSAPLVNFTNGIACLNQGTQFTDASDPTAKAWLWSIQNSTYTTKNPTHVFSVTGSQPVMLSVTGSNNCVSQLTKNVNVPIPVAPDFTAISTCAGKPTIFQEKNSGGSDPAVSWSWDFGGQGMGSGSPAEHIFQTVGSYAVKMNSTRQSGCVYSITKSVLINQSPQAQFIPSTDSGGSPLTVGFTNTSSLATSYLWKFMDANNSTSTEFSPSFIFNQLGEYPVELIASNALGCQDSYIKMIQVVVPSVNAVLTEFKLIPVGGSMKATVTVQNKGNISMNNPEVIIDLSGGASVKEKLSGTILPNQSLTRTLSIDILSKNLQYACAELYTVGDTYLFDNRQCINLEAETIAIQPYPNPAQDELFIDWINAGNESMQVVIYNASGHVVLNKKYEPILLGLNQVKVNVSNLGAGIYFVSYFDGNTSRTSRFSIVR